jgi:hypothetical protein
MMRCTSDPRGLPEKNMGPRKKLSAILNANKDIYIYMKIHSVLEIFNRYVCKETGIGYSDDSTSTCGACCWTAEQRGQTRGGAWAPRSSRRWHRAGRAFLKLQRRKARSTGISWPGAVAGASAEHHFPTTPKGISMNQFRDPTCDFDQEKIV